MNLLFQNTPNRNLSTLQGTFEADSLEDFCFAFVQVHVYYNIREYGPFMYITYNVSNCRDPLLKLTQIRERLDSQHAARQTVNYSDSSS